MKLIKDKKNCCGCTACSRICPKNAISMLSDEKGFLYPNINSKLCVQCGLCEKVCPFYDGFKIKENLAQPDVYAVKHNSDNVRMKSSSGGVFTAVSDYVLNKNGVVYGACYDSNFIVYHQRAENKEDRDSLCGSKYVQSDLKLVFNEVKEDLINDRYVLFSGTPCQTAGLYNFIKSQSLSSQKLYLCDLICHGVPSPTVFQDYLSNIKKKYHSEISNMTFRYKPAGWKIQTISIHFKNGKKYISTCSDDEFYNLFLKNYILRESCYNCKFTNYQRPSDITIGDFWGIESVIPKFEDSKGVSLVLINTLKGKKLFNEISKDITFEKSSPEGAKQPNLYFPSKPNSNVTQFWLDYKNHGYSYAADKHSNSGVKGKLKKMLKNLGLLNAVRNMLKNHR